MTENSPNPNPMLRLSQWSDLWSEQQIGSSNVKVGTDGCLLTAIAMVRSGFYPYHLYNQPYVRPDEFAKLPIFNSAGEIIWSKIAPILKASYGMEFIWRDYNYFASIDTKNLKAYCNNPDYGVCIEVLTRNGTKHWLALVGRSIKNLWLGWAANDPWNGKRLWKTVGFNAPYVRVLGFAIFRKHEKLEKMTSDE